MGGGGNSAGQAAIFLAGGCKRVHLLVRSNGLADSMSQYLIRRIEELPNVTLHVRTEITALDGVDQLDGVTWKTADGAPEKQAIRHVFLMTGALPCTPWLNSCIALNDKGFVRTGSDLRSEDLSPAIWKNGRQPEFSRPTSGIFAVGDVRCGSVKRVARSREDRLIQQVHRVLHE